MPIPIIVGAAIAGVAGAAGIGTAAHGAKKMKNANDTMKATESQHRRNIEKFENQNKLTIEKMDELGKLELKVLKGFEDFSNVMEKIQNRPKFKPYSKDGVTLPTIDNKELKTVSVGAGVLLGGIGGAAAGTFGGFAAAGATTSATMALDAVSIGRTAISSLRGITATNATLAALGGGSALAAGGGGMAIGATILGATTLGVGLLVGGIIFNVSGGKLSDKADEAYSQMKKAESSINKICRYLSELEKTAEDYTHSINIVRNKYLESYNYISYVVNKLHKVDWNEFSEQDKLAVKNTVMLVGLLYEMCKLNLVNKASNENEMNTINKSGINIIKNDSIQVIDNLN